MPDGATRPHGRGPGRRAHGRRITARDEEILRWVARHGVVTAELIGWRFFWRPQRKTYGRWAVYRRLRILQELGLLLSDKPFAQHPAALRVTREGARLAGAGLRPAPLVVSQLRHSLSVVQLTEILLDDHPGSELVTERELRARRYRELAAGERSLDQGRCPDAVLRIPSRGPGAQAVITVAIELDLSRKDRRAMERMVYQYDREPVDAVWWYVTPARVERVTRFVRELNAQDRMEVRPWRG
jgi:hypothetical protein